MISVSVGVDSDSYRSVAESSRPASSAEIHVLIIEDNEEHAQLLERLLASSEYPRFRTSFVHTVADGLEKLSAGGIEMVLLDLSLPDSQGAPTFRKVSELVPNLPVVILSGISDVTLAIEMVQQGAQDYLVKGHVDNHLLLRSIQYAIERKRAEIALKEARDELDVRVQERTAELLEANSRLHAEIAERKRAEEQSLESNRQLMEALSELRSMQQDLVRRERLRALGHMADGIAHEFNNVLTPIVGFSEQLLQHGDLLADSEIARGYIQKIYNAALSGSRAVSRVRGFVGARPGVFGALDVAEIIGAAVAFTEPKWKGESLAAGVSIGIATQIGEVPNVHGDATQMGDLLAQLLFNSIHSISRRGMITIGSECLDGEVAIIVQDDGCGMSEGVRLRCLDAKSSLVSQNGRLSGYGIVHGTLAQHGGRIEIESQEGRGTRVLIYLPIVSRNGASVAAPAQIVTLKKFLRILVADDEPMIREVIQMYLSEDDHAVEVAGNGREALEKFMAGEYDVVLTDRSMPELNGDELAVAVKQHRPSVPVILLTGFGDLMNAEGELPSGVDAIIAKPFTLETLRIALARV